MRGELLVNDEYYHIYNRGVDKRAIVMDIYDSERFVQSMIDFNSTETIGSVYEYSFVKEKYENKDDTLVEIIAYCLNPNHFHLLLKQVVDNGISKYMHRLSTGYTNYFNLRYKRSGSLFQGKYKFKHIEDNDYLLHLSAYVNLNYKVHQLGSPTPKLVRTSWGQYCNLKQNKKEATVKCSTSIVLSQFKSTQDYADFALDSVKSTIEDRADSEKPDDLLLE